SERMRGINARGKFLLREAAEAEPKTCFLQSGRQRDAGKPVGEELVGKAGRERDRCSGIVGKARCVFKVQARYVAAEPSAELALTRLRDRNLIADDIDQRGARLQRRFGE